MTRPRLPLSAPAMTTTSSFFFTCCLRIRIGRRIGLRLRLRERLRLRLKRRPQLDNLWSQGDDLHEFLVAQLARHRSKNASAARIQFCVNNHDGVAIYA